MKKENLYRVTVEIEFKVRDLLANEVKHFSKKSKIYIRVKAEDEDEAIRKADYSLAETYGEDILDGEFLDCELIA